MLNTEATVRVARYGSLLTNVVYTGNVYFLAYDSSMSLQIL